jgi:hypothetical protein
MSALTDVAWSLQLPVNPNDDVGALGHHRETVSSVF